jgi:hypothetical protein
MMDGHMKMLELSVDNLAILMLYRQLDGHSLVEEQVRYGWTVCDVWEQKVDCKTADSMDGDFMTVLTQKMLE